jgi:hypothetical protein
VCPRAIYFLISEEGVEENWAGGGIPVWQNEQPLGKCFKFALDINNIPLTIDILLESEGSLISDEVTVSYAHIFLLQWKPLNVITLGQP